jgi:hypothetical protein
MPNLKLTAGKHMILESAYALSSNSNDTYKISEDKRVAE